MPYLLKMKDVGLEFRTIWYAMETENFLECVTVQKHTSGLSEDGGGIFRTSDTTSFGSH